MSDDLMEHFDERGSLPAWTQDTRRPVPADALTDAFMQLLVHAERANACREGLRDTPARAARAWLELTAGYGPMPDLTTFPADGHDQIIIVRGLPFYSLCEHHLLPFFGTADFAYVPGDLILGLSKFARLLEHYSRRLQIQERLTTQLADGLIEALLGIGLPKIWHEGDPPSGPMPPQGVFVIVRAEHMCMSMRGVQKPGHTTVTSVVRGVFKDDIAARGEALSLLIDV